MLALVLARAESGRRDRARPAADRGVDDAAIVEVDHALVTAELRCHAEHARLPAQVEELEDVVDAELLERSLDRHGQLASREAKMCCRSCAVRISRRARFANSPDGEMSMTRRHWSMASG